MNGLFFMDYVLSFSERKSRILHIRARFTAEGSVRLQLPLWRPGRYERQHYAENLGPISVQADQPCILTRISSHSWSLESPGSQQVELIYTYYCHQWDAGGSFLDRQLIYLNLITCLLYVPEKAGLPHHLHLELPSNFVLGGWLHDKGTRVMFPDFHALVDTPFLASPNLQLERLQVRDLSVYCWIEGATNLDREKWKEEAAAFIEAQLALFGSIPVKEYHFICLFTPKKMRHGVEHLTSTVLVMGPGNQMNEPAQHQSFLELCSHELFHVWNVKYFRPQEMTPYDYSRETYTALHYITEGITTYYGDLMLWKAGVWEFPYWVAHSLNGELKRHYLSGGEATVSLAEASFTSWINGYQDSGMPNQRISFYTKGYLVAALMDLYLRRVSGHEASLDRVMQHMYRRFSPQKGYSEQEFMEILASLAEVDWTGFFEKYISGIADMRSAWKDLGDFLGMRFLEQPPDEVTLAWLGFDVQTTRSGWRVRRVKPGSPAATAGMVQGDLLVKIQGEQPSDIQLFVENLRGQQLEIEGIGLGRLPTYQLDWPSWPCVLIPQFEVMEEPSAEQMHNREKWREIPGFQS